MKIGLTDAVEVEILSMRMVQAATVSMEVLNSRWEEF